jgi:hypothetical protein
MNVIGILMGIALNMCGKHSVEEKQPLKDFTLMSRIVLVETCVSEQRAMKQISELVTAAGDECIVI